MYFTTPDVYHHEAGHAVMALFTGGRIESIQADSNGGVTETRERDAYGARMLVFAAGMAAEWIAASDFELTKAHDGDLEAMRAIRRQFGHPPAGDDAAIAAAIYLAREKLEHPRVWACVEQIAKMLKSSGGRTIHVSQSRSKRFEQAAALLWGRGRSYP